jgi:hypothetical protein
MKIIITESQKNVLLEELGVATQTVPYINLVYQVLEPIVTEFLNGSEKKLVKDITITPTQMSEVYKYNPDDFIDFPVEEIKISLSCNKVSPKKMQFDFTTGGAAYRIEDKSSGGSYVKKPSLVIPKKILEELTNSVVGLFDFSVDVTSNYDSSMKDEVLFDLRDTITHEMNHLYEFYNRYQSNPKNKVDVTLTYAGSKNYNVPKDIFAVWNRFLYFIYFSEPYEMRAMSQEAYSKRLRMTFDEFKNTRYWKFAKAMEEFDGDKLFDELVQKIEEHNPEYVLPILNRLYYWFMKDYYQGVKDTGGTPKKYIDKSKHLLDLMLKFEPIINKAGSKLQRNFMRLYSLLPDEN